MICNKRLFYLVLDSAEQRIYITISKRTDSTPLRLPPPALSDSQVVGVLYTADRARRGWVGKCLEDARGCCPFYHWYIFFDAESSCVLSRTKWINLKYNSVYFWYNSDSNMLQCTIKVYIPDCLPESNTKYRNICNNIICTLHLSFLHYKKI